MGPLFLSYVELNRCLLDLLPQALVTLQFPVQALELMA